MTFFNKLKRFSWFSLFVIAALCLSSIFFIASSASNFEFESDGLPSIVRSQLIWVPLGFLCFFVFSFIDYTHWKKLASPIYFISLFALFLVLIIGYEVNHSKSWFSFGPFRVQPAEFSKLAFIIFASFIMLQIQSRGIRLFLTTMAIATVPMLLILKQPDLGSALVFLPAALVLLLVLGLQKRYFVVIFMLAALGVSYLYFGVHQKGYPIPLLKKYQVNRILVFFDPNRDPRGAGWQIRQSLIAIASGETTGKGWKQGDLHRLGYLPRTAAYNDFIFSVIAEEFGFYLTSVLLIFLLLILLICVRTALAAKDKFGMLIASGISAMFFTHTFINVGMTMKVTPITGIPMPFISYGGSFLIVCMCAMGIVQSIWIHRPR